MDPAMPVPSVDWTPLLKSPLALLLPVMAGIAAASWIVTEAASFFVPTKWRPALAMILGIALGYATNRATLLDYGAGPDGWLRALIVGLLGGALAVLLHPHIKDRFPFKMLTRVTPSGAPAGGQP